MNKEEKLDRIDKIFARADKILKDGYQLTFNDYTIRNQCENYLSAQTTIMVLKCSSAYYIRKDTSLVVLEALKGLGVKVMPFQGYPLEIDGTK